MEMPCLDSVVTVRLAAPRGFCAGVSRAIEAVEAALERFGAPVFVRHQIVHNAHVVRRLEAMGAVFVDEVHEAPPERPLIISAHGAPPSVYQEADGRAGPLIDGSCPLVLKVHNEIRRQAARGRHILLIGHAGHAEIIGSMGQAPSASVTLIENSADALGVVPPDGQPLAYVTQTTLSIVETADIIAILKERFPSIEAPSQSDICYATSNRQAAVKATAPGSDLFLVIGDASSSNSQRLVETALAAGARKALLISDPGQWDGCELDGVRVIGVSSGASSPEDLVEELLVLVAARRKIRIENIQVAEETVVFRPPTALAGRR